MPPQVTLETDRLILRPWKESDLVPFAALNADPRVMECFPSVKTFEESKFDHPLLSKDHKLSRHVLYRIKKA